MGQQLTMLPLTQPHFLGLLDLLDLLPRLPNPTGFEVLLRPMELQDMSSNIPAWLCYAMGFPGKHSSSRICTEKSW